MSTQNGKARLKLKRIWLVDCSSAVLISGIHSGAESATDVSILVVTSVI